MGPVSPPKGADDGPNGGYFVFRAISLASDVRDTRVGGLTRLIKLAFPHGPPNFRP